MQKCPYIIYGYNRLSQNKNSPLYFSVLVEKGWLQEACTLWRHSHMRTVTYCKVREKSSAWIAPDLVMQLKHFKSRKSLPPKITCPQYNSDVDNALETCSSSKAIRSSLCPHSGQIQSYAAYARPHLITPRQSISISIVSIKGFQPHVMHSRHATDETVWPWSELQYKHRDITLM